MGIQLTRYISRQSAIERIREVASLIESRDYLAIEQGAFEPDGDVLQFAMSWAPIEIENVDRWTDRMLEDYMDNPFFRFSMFDNYLIGEDRGE